MKVCGATLISGPTGQGTVLGIGVGVGHQKASGGRAGASQGQRLMQQALF